MDIQPHRSACCGLKNDLCCYCYYVAVGWMNAVTHLGVGSPIHPTVTYRTDLPLIMDKKIIDDVEGEIPIIEK